MPQYDQDKMVKLVSELRTSHESFALFLTINKDKNMCDT